MQRPMKPAIDAARSAELEDDNRRPRRLLDQRDAPGDLRSGVRSTLSSLRSIVRRSAESSRDLPAYAAHQHPPITKLRKSPGVRGRPSAPPSAASQCWSRIVLGALGNNSISSRPPSKPSRARDRLVFAARRLQNAVSPLKSPLLRPIRKIVGILPR